MINKDTTHQVVELAAAIQNEESFDDFVETTLSRLEKIFKANSSVVLNWNDFKWGGRTLSKEDMFFHNDNVNQEWNYPALHHEDPLYEWIQSGHCHGDLNAIRLSDLISFRQLKKTRFYTELLQAMDCRYVLTMAVHHQGDILASISVTRPQEDHDFSTSDVLLAQLITPILANALSHILLKTQNEQQIDIFNILNDKLDDKAIIIFSDDFKSVYRNEKMTRLGKQLSKYGNSISDIFERSARVKRNIELFKSHNKAKQRRLPKLINDIADINENLSISIQLEFSIQSNKAYLLVYMERNSDIGQGSDIQQDYDLSQREYQIYQLAINGLSSQEMGKELAISPWSVKNHLKNIYKKTGVNTRIQLTQLASASV